MRCRFMKLPPTLSPRTPLDTLPGIWVLVILGVVAEVSVRITAMASLIIHTDGMIGLPRFVSISDHI